MDLKARIADVIRQNGGRLSCNQLISLFSENYLKDPESKRLFKKAVLAVAVVEHGEDKRRFVVLKELARNKENVTTDQTVVSQSTQTPTSRLPVDIHAQKHVCGTANGTVAKQQQVQAYSTYTGSEPRQWWIASAECRQADMSRLLGLNPKLVNWNNPVDGTALHYASKYSSAQCMRLLLDQYKANVNARSRGQTPLHVAVVFSQPVAIRLLVEEFKADTAIMDFSGRFPVSYLKEEQRSEFEKLLTAGRLARIRDALHILRPKTGPTVECRGDYTSFLHPNSDINLFKSPMVPKHGGKPLCPDSLSKHYGSLSHRSSTLRSATNPVGRVGRQGSVLLNMLHSAANAVHCDPYSEQRAHGTLYARTVSAGTNDESGASKPSGAGDACSLDSSASSDLGCLQSSLVNRVVLEPNDTALATIPYHKLPKHPPRSADPETLAILLSLLPSSPSDQSPGKKKKANGHNYRKVFRHPRSPSSHSLALDSVDKLPRKSSFSHSAELAETDIRSLFGRRMHGVLQRKKSTNSLHSANSSLDPEISDSHVNCSLRTQFRCRSVDCGILSKP